MLNKLSQIAELHEKDSFLLCLCKRNGNNIDTQCITHSFQMGDIVAANREIQKNLSRIVLQHTNNDTQLEQP